MTVDLNIKSIKRQKNYYVLIEIYFGVKHGKILKMNTLKIKQSKFVPLHLFRIT